MIFAKFLRLRIAIFQLLALNMFDIKIKVRVHLKLNVERMFLFSI